ncbi:GNAT family N-acetyltransferase [Dysgonomonas macrotermitis]|uniref:Acetyltransferase (GNAT) domain-containing protein n=1 Tax=Dysgonomonas macrotermitis TaxID=1346286 RepID=A0A1M4X2J1_9BACT|nr:GNAT family N-acetyltransferase [Dysgonomonas macrotermitis]SHE87728.1 Acetyltransferase (GNAT) domain-containing protein [Dysgonomonas macrotermitis]
MNTSLIINNFSIEKMQMSDLDKVAGMQTDAFETNPAYASIFKKSHLREGLDWLFRTSLYLLNCHEVLTRVIKDSQTGDIIGTFTLVPPDSKKNGLRDYLQLGIPAFIFKFGFSTLLKMMRLGDYNKKVLTDSIGTDSYYYLSMVVVKDEYRGRGVGSFAIGRCLDELQQIVRKSDLLGLTTQLPENVSFYSRLGFELVDEGEIRFGGAEYYNYNMKYVFS